MEKQNRWWKLDWNWNILFLLKELKEQAVMEFASNYTELVGEQLLPYYKMMPDLDETQNVEYNVNTVFLVSHQILWKITLFLLLE